MILRILNSYLFTGSSRRFAAGILILGASFGDSQTLHGHVPAELLHYHREVPQEHGY